MLTYLFQLLQIFDRKCSRRFYLSTRGSIDLTDRLPGFRLPARSMIFSSLGTWGDYLDSIKESLVLLAAGTTRDHKVFVALPVGLLATVLSSRCANGRNDTSARCAVRTRPSRTRH